DCEGDQELHDGETTAASFHGPACCASRKGSCWRTDEWFGVADEWPQSVIQVSAGTYIIDAGRPPGIRGPSLHCPGAPPIFHARQGRVPGRFIMVGFWVLLAIVLVVVFWVISLYNRLVGARNGFKNAFAQIDVQLKRRYDLIPNLVETA